MEIVWTLFIGIGGGKKLRSLNEHHELFPVCHGTVWPVRRVWGSPPNWWLLVSEVNKRAFVSGGGLSSVGTLGVGHGRLDPTTT